MSVRQITEGIEGNTRTLTVQVGSDRAPGVVFVGMPCPHTECGQHLLAFDRGEFYEYIKTAFGFVDPLAEMFALPAHDPKRNGHE